MAVATNADSYTNGRVGHFFTANDQTPADGNLTGQCVTLVKWFFAQMCDGFPNPFAARGDARYVGRTLVGQGLATEIPFAARQRGDIIVYEYGKYGHIAVQLSGGRVFESNINWSGVASRIVDGERVFASRIGNEQEAWRADKNPHVYRVKGYNEGGAPMPEPTIEKVSLATARILAYSALGRNGVTNPINALAGQCDDDLLKNHVGQPFTQTYVRGLYESGEAQGFREKLSKLSGAPTGVVPYSGDQLYVLKKEG